jgi:acylphosphatase
MVSAVRLLVRGVVQGVGYRYWTERQARELGLRGWVRNLDDGRVEIFAEGEPAALDELERRCHRGPRSASVDQVAREARPVRGLLSFAADEDADAPEP